MHHWWRELFVWPLDARYLLEAGDWCFFFAFSIRPAGHSQAPCRCPAGSRTVDGMGPRRGPLAKRAFASSQIAVGRWRQQASPV